MGFSNNMTLLVNKIEARLGLDMLDLPEKMTKDKWPDKIIIPDTLTTWSRYYPNEFRHHITQNISRKMDGIYWMKVHFRIALFLE